jgi:predicted regulator of Ras-like GTPase activity (Roadblock/LC7/MglB family)
MALRGSLGDIDMADLIQLTCQSSTQALLRAEHDNGQIISVYFADGEIAHAEYGDVRGEDAVYALLGWEAGKFEVEQGVSPPEQTITLPWSALVMEGMRRLDESRMAQSEELDEKEQEEMAAETRREQLANSLRNLLDSSGDINGVAVVSMDGLIMAADLPSGVEQARVGAVAAAILSLSGRSVGQLKRGNLEQTTVQGSDGHIIITHASDKAALVALTGKNVNLGMVFLEVQECAEAVAGLIG